MQTTTEANRANSRELLTATSGAVIAEALPQGPVHTTPNVQKIGQGPKHIEPGGAPRGGNAGERCGVGDKGNVGGEEGGETGEGEGK